jgi:hypothetical protein
MDREEGERRRAIESHETPPRARQCMLLSRKDVYQASTRISLQKKETGMKALLPYETRAVSEASAIESTV